jgi:hypothetical protein
MPKYPGCLYRKNDRFKTDLDDPVSTVCVLTDVQPLAIGKCGKQNRMNPGL